MLELKVRGCLERKNLAALRIDTAHYVFDRAVLAGRIHRLKNEEHRPPILGIKLVLEFCHARDAVGEGLLGMILRMPMAGIGRIEVLELEMLSVINAEGIGEFLGLHSFSSLIKTLVLSADDRNLGDAKNPNSIRIRPRFLHCLRWD